MRPSLSRLTVWLTVLVALVATAGRASAQCAITGPTQVCGSPVTLCAPDGSVIYVWTLPDGSQEYTQCILATTPGVYGLTYIDPAVGGSVDCSTTLTAAGPAPVITGANSACAGTPIDLCGPDGNLAYDWLSPNGVSSTTRCVSASVPGIWLLRVRTLDSSCWTDYATQEIAFTTCDPSPSPSPSPSPDPSPSPSPSPSPAPDPGPNCPRAAWWWAQQCDHDMSNSRLDASTMNSIAACVAGHDLDLEGGLCATMNAGRRTLRMRARRQVAAVWANVCANGLNVTTRDGRPVALDPATIVDLGEFHGTVSLWLAQAGTTLSAMGASSGKNAKRSDDEACRRLIRVAWQLNHGIGVGPVCRPDRPHGDDLVAGAPSATSAMSGSSADAWGTTADPEPLAAELMADADTPLAFGVIQPNPVRSHMTMAYSITTTDAQEVTIGVYDISGRLVRELVRGSRAPGEYVATWDGLDRNGTAVRGGLYFVLGRVAGVRVQSNVTFVR